MDGHDSSVKTSPRGINDPLALHRPDPDAEGEERFIAVGLGSAGQILVVVYTRRGEDIRLISASHATRREIRMSASRTHIDYLADILTR